MSIWFDLLIIVVFLGLEVVYYFNFKDFEKRVTESLDNLALEIRQLHRDPEYVKELFKDKA